jgi:integrase
MACRIKIAIFEGGERLPMLVDSVTGTPLFLPSVYSVTAIRARNRAANTIGHALRAILHLYASADAQGIDLEVRFRRAKWLSVAEIDCLVRDASVPTKNLTPHALGPVSANRRVAARGLESARQPSKAGKHHQVDMGFAANRLRYMRDYLNWLALHQLGRMPRDSTIWSDADAARLQMTQAIDARLPTSGKRSILNAREGLSDDALEQVVGAVKVDSDANPWSREYVRHRNQLLVHWSYLLGLRRGELLGVKIEDVDFRKGEVTIRRRADDPLDPRPNQPNAKTRDRNLPLPTDLLEMTQHFIIQHRQKLYGARKNSFLFVADRTGRPLSMAAMTKVISTFREQHPEVSDDLSWHTFRFTWNDHFSELMDKNRIPEEREEKQRSYLMGWTEGSGSAKRYTRRHLRKKARNASLELQDKMLNGKKNGKHQE